MYAFESRLTLFLLIANQSPFYPIPLPKVASPISLGLPGPHQLSNASLALYLIRIFLSSTEGQQAFPQGTKTFSSPPSRETTGMTDDQSLEVDLDLTEVERKGLENSRWPGRCQVVKSPSTSSSSSTTYHLDGAHTTDSLALCAKWFVSVSSETSSDKKPKPIRALIFNCTNGRKAEELLGSMLDAVESNLSSEGSRSSASRFQFANQWFDQVRFCTNTTFKDGASAGGESYLSGTAWVLIRVWGLTASILLPPLATLSDLTSVAASTDSSTLSLTVQQELKTAYEKLIDSGSNPQVQVKASIQDAIESIESQDDREVDVLVAGSLHLVGGVMAHLKEWGWLDQSLKSVGE